MVAGEWSFYDLLVRPEIYRPASKYPKLAKSIKKTEKYMYTCEMSEVEVEKQW